MPFYKKKITYDEIAPLTQKFRLWLRSNATVLKEYDETENVVEAFLIDVHINEDFTQNWWKIWNLLRESNYISISPLAPTETIVYWYTTAEGPRPTVSPTHVRLPKLSHLITLVPSDFFDVIRLITTSKKTQAGDSLQLNPAAIGINHIDSCSISQFFTKLRTNYRLNHEYADRKWTYRTDLNAIADLEQTRDNQLSAMQYLTALQNSDLMYFPADSSVELQLDWEQISDEYCIPPNRTQPSQS